MDDLQNYCDSDSCYYVVTYAKITIGKDKDVSLNGVYFGGVSTDLSEAEDLANKCINTIKGGTILPRIITATDPLIINSLYEAESKFESIVNGMRETRNVHLRKKR